MIISVLLLSALCFVGLKTQCPEPSSLKDAEGNKLCARLFEDSHYYNEQSCSGQYLDVYPMDDVPIVPIGWNNRISSLVVAPRCTLTAWSRSKKEGKKHKFSSGIQYRLKEVAQGLFGNWNDDISGYYCEQAQCLRQPPTVPLTPLGLTPTAPSFIIRMIKRA
ncbi:syncollin [Arapaima gigas]